MDPLSLGIGALGGLGSLFHGITSLFGGNAQAAADRAAATQANMDAGVNAQEKLIEGNRTAAEGAVRAAANGGGLTGSSIGVIQDLSDQAMFNARASIYQGRTRAQADLYNAGVAQAQGWQGLIGGVVGAGGSVLGGFQQAALLSRLAQSGSPAYSGGSGYGFLGGY